MSETIHATDADILKRAIWRQSGSERDPRHEEQLQAPDKVLYSIMAELGEHNKQISQHLQTLMPTTSHGSFTLPETASASIATPSQSTSAEKKLHETPEETIDSLCSQVIELRDQNNEILRNLQTLAQRTSDDEIAGLFPKSRLPVSISSVHDLFKDVIADEQQVEVPEEVVHSLRSHLLELQGHNQQMLQFLHMAMTNSLTATASRSFIPGWNQHNNLDLPEEELKRDFRISKEEEFKRDFIMSTPTFLKMSNMTLDFSEEEFKRDFRMSKATFEMICEELDSTIMKTTLLQEAIPAHLQVAICIWRLASGKPLRLVSKRFGLGISTCNKIFLKVCAAIRTVLMPKFLKWPDEQRMKTIKGEFESMSVIQNVAGSMYTTHVPIIEPKISVATYLNRRHTERNQKTSYSITVQGVVDPKGVFTDVCIGWPGSMPDDRVLENSALFRRASQGLLRGVWIVGNSGFPLLDWLLVPYTKQNLTRTQQTFNEKVGDVQKVAKEAFARLKGRWSCLQKRTEVKLQDLPVVVGACCVLHNICEMRNEEIDPTAKFEIFDDEMVAENSIRSANSEQKRDQIAHNLVRHGLAGTSFL